MSGFGFPLDLIWLPFSDWIPSLLYKTKHQNKGILLGEMVDLMLCKKRLSDYTIPFLQTVVRNTLINSVN